MHDAKVTPKNGEEMTDEEWEAIPKSSRICGSCPHLEQGPFCAAVGKQLESNPRIIDGTFRDRECPYGVNIAKMNPVEQIINRGEGYKREVLEHAANILAALDEALPDMTEEQRTASLKARDEFLSALEELSRRWMVVALKAMKGPRT